MPSNPKLSHRWRWLWWVGGILLLVSLGVTVALAKLDSWLKRTLEQRVTAATHGRYQLRVGSVETSLLARSIELEQVRVSTTQAGRPADTLALPALRLRVGRLRVAGVGLLALLRREELPVGQILIDSVDLWVARLPETNGPQRPLHEQLPERVPGLHVKKLALRRAYVAYGPQRQPLVAVGPSSLTATDVLLTPAGAADSTRFYYAAAVTTHLRGLRTTAGNHRISWATAHASTQDQILSLDSVRVQPLPNAPINNAAATLWLPRLQLTGLRYAQLRQRRFRADTLRILKPQLRYRPAKQTAPPLHQGMAPYLRSAVLAQLHVERGQLQDYTAVTDIGQLSLTASDIRIDSASYQQPERFYYAADVALRARRFHTVAAGHQLAIVAADVSTEQRYLRLDSVRVRALPDASPQKSRVDLWLPQLKLAGLTYAKLRERRFLADTLRLTAPRLEYTAGRAASKPAHESLAPLRQLQLGRLVLERAEVQVRGVAGAPRVGQLTLNATDVRVDAASFRDPRRLYYAAAVEVRAQDVAASAAGHRVELNRAVVSSGRGYVQATGLRVQPLPGLQGGSPRLVLEPTEITLTGLRYGLLRQQQLRADTLRLVASQLRFRPPAKQPPPPHVALRPYLRQVELKRLHIQCGDARVDGVKLTPRVQNTYLLADDVRVDAAGYRNPRRICYARAWTGGTGPASGQIDTPYYRMSYQSLELDTRRGMLLVRDALMKPTMSQPELSVRKGHQTGHITFRTPLIQATDVDFPALVRRGSVRARVLAVRQPSVHVIDGGNYPINSATSHITPEAIGRLPFRLDVRQLQVRGLDIYIRHRGMTTGLVGTMQLTRISGTISNLSNDPRRMSAATPAVLRATGWLQNQCFVQTTMWLPLRAANGEHRIEGSFGPAPFGMLNSITKPVSKLGFRRGQAQRVTVQMQADRLGIRGTMMAHYSRLKISFLSAQTDTVGKTLLSRVGSKLANVVVVRDSNPRSLMGKLKEGTVQSERDPRYSIFALWRQGLVSGLLNSIGVPDEVAKHLSEP